MEHLSQAGASDLEEQQVFVVLDRIGVGHDPFEFF
jgi:hypothetical protein